MIEKILFNLLAISLFIIVFFIMARKNDTNYISLLVLEAIGIAINFIELNIGITQNVYLTIIEYILAIVIPLAVLILEKNNIKYSEILAVAKNKYYIVTNQDDKTRNMLVKLVTKYPNSYICRKMLANCYEKAEKYEDSIIEYYRATELKDSDYFSRYRIADLLIKIDKGEEAEKTLKYILNNKPDFYLATNLLGDLLYNQQRFKEAIHIYTEALKYNPNDYNLYYDLGMVYIGLNDFPNAKLCYEKAADINSKLYNAYYTLGQLALISNDIEEAEKYFSEGLYGDVEADSYYELSKIYMLKNEKDKAITFVQKAIEIEPEYIKVARKEPIFIPIKQYIAETKSDTNYKNTEKVLTEKETNIQKKLLKTNEIVEKIGFKQREEKIEKQKKNQGNKDKNRDI